MNERELPVKPANDARVNVLGVGVSVLNLTTALDGIARAVAERR